MRSSDCCTGVSRSSTAASVTSGVGRPAWSRSVVRTTTSSPVRIAWTASDAATSTISSKSSGVPADGAVSSTTVNSGSANLDVLADHQRAGARRGRPVDHAWVVTGDVLAHRDEPDIGSDGGSRSTDSFSTMWTAPCGPDEVVDLGMDDHRARAVSRRRPTVSQNGSIRSISKGPTSNTPRRRVGIDPVTACSVFERDRRDRRRGPRRRRSGR